MDIILASKSPRRREILQNLGMEFRIELCETDESSDITEPAELVSELAFRKALAVFKKLKDKGELGENSLVIGCDTLVCCDNEILGKPKSRDDARRMIKLLSGRAHSVLSGLALLTNNKTLVRYEETKVFFDKMTEQEIEEYISSPEPYDKAGGYAVQGLAARYINRLEGCYFNVVGLPVHLLYKMILEIERKE